MFIARNIDTYTNMLGMWIHTLITLFALSKTATSADGDGFMDAPGIFLAIEQKICRFNISTILLQNPTFTCRYADQISKRLEVDVAHNNFYLSLEGTNTLVRHNFQIDSNSFALYRPTNGIDAISFDWVGGNIYWVESSNGILGVANKVDYRTYIKTGLDNPKGVAVDPQKGVVYWSDGTPSISFLNMTTNAPGIFMGSNVYKPESLCLDFAAKRLYWVDNGIGNQGVYSVNTETGAATDFKKHITLSNYMVDITLLKDLAFVSATTPTGSELISFSKDSGANKITMSFTTDSIGDVTVYDEYNQPVAQNPCRENNGGCDHICIPSGDNSVCLCNLRYILHEDGKTCKVDIPMEHFLLVADGGAERIYQVGLDNEYVDPLPMPDELSTPISVTFDPVTRYIYYTNLDQHRVNRIHITDPFNIQSIRVFGESYLEGIAIDSGEQKIYVVDSTAQIVYRMDADGGNLEDIVDNTDNPRALVLWTEKRLLYWSDWGTHKKIERASMDDGSNRTVIIESDLSGPNGLAIDFSELKLYWTDNGFDNVERSDLDGSNREVIAQIHSKLFGITFYGQYLYVTDRDSRSIFKINKNNGSYSVLGSGVFNIPYGIFMVTESLQTSTFSATQSSLLSTVESTLNQSGAVFTISPTNESLQTSTFSATQSSLLSTVESTLNQSGAVFAISPTKNAGKEDLRVIIGASIGTVLFVLLVAAGIGIGCYCKRYYTFRKNESSSPGTPDSQINLTPTVGHTGSGNEPNRDSNRINEITILNLNDVNGFRPADRDASKSLNRLSNSNELVPKVSGSAEPLAD